MARHQAWPIPYREADAAAFIESLDHDHPGTPGAWFQFAIERAGELIGDLGLYTGDDGASAILGVSIRAEDHDRGFGTEAMSALIDYAGSKLGIARFEIRIESRNMAARALAARLGFAHVEERPYADDTGTGVELRYELTSAQHRWNQRYRGGDTPDEPSEWLLRFADDLPPQGRALDVACGAGRNAVWLARQGLEVTAVDVSPVALDIVAERATRAGVALTTYRCDLERTEPPPGPWNVIVYLHYLQRDLMPQLILELSPGGMLVAAWATVRNLERNERPPLPYLVDEGEAPRLVVGLDVVVYEEGWTESGRHEARVMARKPSVDRR